MERRRDHTISKYLDDKERKSITSCFSSDEQCVASAITQVTKSCSGAWTIVGTGLATLVKDYALKTYFIRVFDLFSQQVLYSLELYTTLKYDTPTPFFAVFEGLDAVYGLNFADEGEADKFGNFIIDKQDRRKAGRAGMHRENAAQAPQAPSMLKSALVGNSSSLNNLTTKLQKGKGKKLSKGDIGRPINFMHISHGGFTDGKITSATLQPEMKNLFVEAGFDSELMDDNELKAVMGTIQQCGGMDRVKREYGTKRTAVESRPLPPVPPQPLEVRGRPDTGTLRKPPTIAPPPIPPISTNVDRPLPQPPSGSAKPCSRPSLPPPPPLPITVQRPAAVPPVPPPVIEGKCPPPPPPIPTENKSYDKRETIPDDRAAVFLDIISKGHSQLKPTKMDQHSSASSDDAINSCGNNGSLADVLRRVFPGISRFTTSCSDDDDVDEDWDGDEDD